MIARTGTGLNARKHIKAGFKPVCPTLRDLQSLMLGVIGRGDAVDDLLRAIYGEVGMDLDHGDVLRDQFSGVDLDFVVVLGERRKREDDQKGCDGDGSEHCPREMSGHTLHGCLILAARGGEREIWCWIQQKYLVELSAVSGCPMIQTRVCRFRFRSRTKSGNSNGILHGRRWFVFDWSQDERHSSDRSEEHTSEL